MNSEFAVKELYEVSIKATDNIEINNTKYEKDEVFLFFEDLQIANISAESSVREAEGGKNNFSWILWDEINSADFIFEGGKLSMPSFNLLTQSRSFNSGENNITIPMRESLISNSDGVITLEYDLEESRSRFVYETLGGIIVKKLEIININKNKVDLGEENANKGIIIDYYFKDNQVSYYEVGGENIKGFFKLTSKIDFVDGKDGLSRTMLLVLPKVRLLSNISLTLGVKASPIVSVFRLRAFPEEGGNTLARFIYLNKDIQG